MGSSASKPARAAASAARKYPTRTPPTQPPRGERPHESAAQRLAVRPQTHGRTQARAPVAGSTPGPNTYPAPRASAARDEAINLDSSDPDLGLQARLRAVGPVQPNPTLSNSSTVNYPASSNTANQHANAQFQPSASSPLQTLFPSARGPSTNPAVALLEARSRLAEAADTEFSNIGRRGAEGRTFLDVITVRQVLQLRDERGLSGSEIEKRMGLGHGVVEQLGRRGVVACAGY
ncbi:hypothetical protein BP6252_01766 [Coleophoma cylindrospora]|uniref:Helix-turn-helix domain-containing protein n=1 Tax=Coleophoma cylindrospora TaxID=1849047 RepID=A0A3D8SU00_9HELO|nr:hypothetical protein BP6252_01766 [Coleophoma cylindrospora]